jgi:hypothetical protein
MPRPRKEWTPEEAEERKERPRESRGWPFHTCPEDHCSAHAGSLVRFRSWERIGSTRHILLVARGQEPSCQRSTDDGWYPHGDLQRGRAWRLAN